MGEEQNDVRLVVHWNLPQSLYNYYQVGERGEGRRGIGERTSGTRRTAVRFGCVLQSRGRVAMRRMERRRNAMAFMIKRDDDEKRVGRGEEAG